MAIFSFMVIVRCGSSYSKIIAKSCRGNRFRPVAAGTSCNIRARNREFCPLLLSAPFSRRPTGWGRRVSVGNYLTAHTCRPSPALRPSFRHFGGSDFNGRNSPNAASLLGFRDRENGRLGTSPGVIGPRPWLAPKWLIGVHCNNWAN